MQLIQLIEWWNIIFLLPPFAALVYIFLMGPTDTDAGSHDASADAHADVHDADTHVHVTVGHHPHVDWDIGHHDVHHDGHHHDAGEGSNPSLLARMLSIFGVGKVPMSILILCLCMIWGVFGFLSNFVLVSNGMDPDYFWWISVIVSGTFSLILLRWISQVVARIFPTYENYGVSRSEFVGEKATVRYTVDKTSGSAIFTDRNGNLQEIECRAKEPLPQGTEVVIIRYSQENGLFIVAPSSELEAKP